MSSVGQELASSPQRSELKGMKEVSKCKLLPRTKVVEDWESPYYIHSICPSTEGQVWTCFNRTLSRLDRKGELIQSVEHKDYISDINLSPITYTLWICDGKNNIFELESRRLTHRFSTKETPSCMCATASNHVIVGMDRHISKFTTQGQMVLTTMAPGRGKPVVCTPWKISECPVTHNVAVADWNAIFHGGDGESRVVIMDPDFKEQFVYGGEIPSRYEQASHKESAPFNPCGVVYDSVGNIIIGDFASCSVLLLSGRGEFLMIIHTDTDCTRTVGVDREDIVWAVFGGENVKALQYSSV